MKNSSLRIRYTTGDIHAGFLLAESLLKNKKVNYARVYELLKDTSKKGHPDAANLLGLLLLEEWFPFKSKKSNTSFLLFKMASEKNHVSAFNNLAHCYETGIGTKINPLKAIYWYSRGAKFGDSCCQHNLAHLYEHGKFLKKNISQALAWYRAAALNGDPFAKNAVKRIKKKL